MDKKRLENFSAFYLDTSEDDIEFMQSELREAGLNPEGSEENIRILIKKAQVEIMLAQGRKFKEEYLNALNDSKIEEAEHENAHTEQNYSFAFRKGDDGDDDFKKNIDDEKKMQIIKKLTEKNKQKEKPDS